MPPSGHSHSSHSSHSSSSHSSSRSSSSRSSSSSSRSSSSSSRSSYRSSYGPSSHSTSSHSSHSTSSHYSSTRTTNTKTTPIMRPRRNQPVGFIPIVTSNTTRSFHCRKHDYVYYPNDWTTSEGYQYRQGYYDEDGNYYKSVAFEDQETLLTCDYCGTQKKVIWKTGSAPTCDNCGATLKIDEVDVIESMGTDFTQTETFNSYSNNNYPYNNNYHDNQYNTNPNPKKQKGLKILLTTIVGTLLSCCCCCIIPMNNGWYDEFGDKITEYAEEQGYEASSSDIPYELNYIYVDEIGRTCYKDGEDFYDSTTQCWFFYNYEMGQWQYWYEDISSDYGNYGWMEFDYNENQWYIEKSNGNWIVLPSNYDTSYLWHFNEDSYANGYDSTTIVEDGYNDYVDDNDWQPYVMIDTSIYVEPLGRTCYLDGEDYYDEQTSCWFYYNQDISPSQWQYWFEGISDQYGDYGWMEYDDNEQQWYIETSNEYWEVLPSYEYSPNLWHFDNQFVYN